MKITRLVHNRVLFAFLILMAGLWLFSAYSGDNADYPGGAPAGYTGSPGDGKDCVQCHGGATTPVTGWITSDIPVEGYVPGNTYTVTVTLTGSGKKGIEVSPQNPSGNLLGTLVAGTGSKLTGSGKYITQTSSTSANPAVWSFGWIAPAAGTGDVTFYGAFTLNKSVTKTSTLTVQEAAQTFSVTAQGPSLICLGLSADLTVTPTGAPGVVTYVWTSVPVGFTSTLQNPTVTPVVSTIYTVVASSEGQTATDQVTVEVVDCTGVPEYEMQAFLSLSPNPAKNSVMVSWPENAGKTASLQVMLPNGTTMFKADKVVPGQTIQTGQWSRGFLLVFVTTDQQRYTGKLLLQ